VYLTSDAASTPTDLMHSLKHYKVPHTHNIVLTVMSADLPRVPADEWVRLDDIGESFSRMTVRFGFMESPNLPKALAIARNQGRTFDIMSTSFFLSRRSIRAAAHSGMPLWQDKLFIVLARNADDASCYFLS
jgi:KUP system potassium uptake protein